MKLKALFVAALLLAPVTLAFAQVAAPVVVAATPATEEAVKNAAWWSGAANEVIAGLATIASAVVAALAIPAVNWLRNRSALAAMFVTQAMIDRMVAGIQNIIRAQAANLEHRLGTDLTADQKKQVAAAAQPKVEAAFKETLQRIGKAPGSQAVNDMILGHVDQALAKAPVAIPAVMARS